MCPMPTDNKIYPCPSEIYSGHKGDSNGTNTKSLRQIMNELRISYKFPLIYIYTLMMTSSHLRHMYIFLW